MTNKWLASSILCFAALLNGCGGSGGDGGSNNASTPVAPAPPVVQANALALTIDAGPAEIQSAGEATVNTLFASVTICTPGSTTACRTIDHMLVDTGSVGIRVIASALGSAVPTPAADPATGGPLRECAQFADGYSYGSVATADVQLGGRTLPGLTIQLIGDAAAGTVPASCVSGPPENTVATFGSNGVIGVGNFPQDCGGACVTSAISGLYYACPTRNGIATCAPTTVALASQIPNPVSKLSADNNGVTIQLPSVPAAGLASTAGSLFFGVNTQSDNAIGAARLFTLTNTGTLTVTYNGTARSGSFIDSGSNGNFFSDRSIAVCADGSFYCPVTASGAPTTLTGSAIVTGTNNVAATVSFIVSNASQAFTTDVTALPGLAGPNSSLQGDAQTAFDFGLPFFYGRTVYVVIAGSSVNGTAGPAIAF